MTENIKAVSVKRSRNTQKTYIEAHTINDKRNYIVNQFKDMALARMAPWKVSRFMRRHMVALPVS